MGIFSSDKKVTTNTTAYNTSIGLQDISGPAVVGEGNVVQVTDFDAVRTGGMLAEQALNVGLDALRLGGEGFQAGADLAADLGGRGLDNALEATRGALAFGESALDTNAMLAERALTSTQDFSRDVLGEIASFGDRAIGGVADFGGRAIDSLTDVSDRALESVTGFGQGALEAVTGAQEGVLDFARDIFGGALQAQQQLTAANISGLTGLARQTSESADDRVTRVVMIVAVAGALAFIASRIWR